MKKSEAACRRTGVAFERCAICRDLSSFEQRLL